MKKDEIDDEFKRRISSARAAKSITQAQLSSSIGISQRQIAAYEAGESKPRQRVLLKLAKALDVNPQWLASGFAGPDVKDHTPYLIGSSSYIPLITIGMVADWLSTGEHNTHHNIRHVTSSLLSSSAFAISLEDEAMASSDSYGYGFPVGSIVSFEPGIDAEDKDFVIAIFSNGKSIFRQYFSGLRESVLSSLDPRFPSERIDNELIENGEVTLVVAVEVKYELPSVSRVEVLESIQFNKKPT